MEKRDIIVIALPIEKVENMGYDLPTLKLMSMGEMTRLANEMEIKREQEDKEGEEQEEPKAFVDNLENFEEDFNADDDFIASLNDYYVFYFIEQ